MKRNVFFTLIGFLLILGLVSCKNPVDNKPNGNGNENDVFVVINLPTNASRNLLDSLIDQTTSYTLTISKDDIEVSTNTIPASQSSITIRLTEVLHLFVLEALNENDVIGKGTAESNLKIGQNHISITLKPIHAYVDIDVGWDLDDDSKKYFIQYI